MDSKIIGYTSLAVGLTVIFFATLQIYLVFTGRSQPLQLGISEGIYIRINEQTPQTEIISSKEANQFVDLTFHYLLMTFLVSVGFRFCNLSSLYLRPINVTVKGETPGSKTN